MLAFVLCLPILGQNATQLNSADVVALNKQASSFATLSVRNTFTNADEMDYITGKLNDKTFDGKFESVNGKVRFVGKMDYEIKQISDNRIEVIYTF